MRRAVFVFAVLVLLAAGNAFAKFDPSFDWTTVETPHFLIHHHQGGEEIAKRVAVLAEDIHNRLTPRIKWEPRDKTHLALVDAMDEANGYSFPIPYNQVVIYLSAPSGEQGLGLVSYDDWLRLVITHEYTHTLQLDMVRRGPRRLQKVLGRIYFPNLFQPSWMIEGLATYEETEQTSGGRGRSAWEEMILRAAVLEHGFPTLGQASVFPDTWPSGLVPYLFGEGFTRYLADRFGRDKIAELSLAYSGRGWPFLVGSTGKQVLGKDYETLWFEWEVELRTKYRDQEKQVRSLGVTPSTRLTNRGFVNTGPAFSPDGSKIAYAVADADEYPAVHVMNADGSNDRAVVENVFPSSTSGASVSWSPDGNRLYYTKVDLAKNTNYYSDLYVYDLRTKKETRLTKGLRSRDPHPSPDGTRILFVMNSLGRTRLATLDLAKTVKCPAGEKDIVLLTPWSSDQYASPRWSPDGSRIAVTVQQAAGFRDIQVLDAGGAKLADVSHDRALDGAPAWSPDGTALYFSSDRSGIYNIYVYDLLTGKAFRLSNVVNGAFTPSPSPDGRSLAITSYSSSGFDIHLMQVPDRGEWAEAAVYVDRYPAMTYEEKSVETASRPYSPLSTIYPRFWLPWAGYSEASGTLLGALTFGQDAVQRHRYVATAFYGPKNSRTWYGLDYFYDGFYPTIHLHASDTDIAYANFLEDTVSRRDYVERAKTYGASLVIPVLKNEQQQAVTIGYRRRDTSALTGLPPWTGYAGLLPGEGMLASGRVKYNYNSSRRYALSISPEDGRTVNLGAERFTESFGSDFEFTKYTADWHEYLDLPGRHHVLQARAFVGRAIGDAPIQGAYQLGGDNPGDVTMSLEDRTVYLRGYPMNVMRGSKVGLASLEYRFPLSVLEKGWNTKAVYFRKLHGALFYEAGSAWDGTLRGDYIRKSVGGELRFDVDLAYYLPITFRFVIARGLDEDGQSQAYLGLWMPLSL
ncbi:MAG: BamA/TamA family outer membrane protein [Nitrospirota bacterium]|nr:BamA/TamA family outer membrane protein [Nitrospirota bacterium]